MERDELGKDADEAPVQLNASTSNVVVIDNVPKTEMKRYEKLYAVIRKIFSAYGTIIDDGLYIPVEGAEPNKMTCGYAFVEVSTHTRSHAPEKQWHGWKSLGEHGCTRHVWNAYSLTSLGCALVVSTCSSRTPRWPLAPCWRAT
jgi:hypothetical protein